MIDKYKLLEEIERCKHANLNYGLQVCKEDDYYDKGQKETFDLIIKLVEEFE